MKRPNINILNKDKCHTDLNAASRRKDVGSRRHYLVTSAGGDSRNTRQRIYFKGGDYQCKICWRNLSIKKHRQTLASRAGLRERDSAQSERSSRESCSRETPTRNVISSCAVSTAPEELPLGICRPVSPTCKTIKRGVKTCPKRSDSVRKRNESRLDTYSQLRSHVESGHQGRGVRCVERKYNEISNRRCGARFDDEVYGGRDLIGPGCRQGSQFSTHPPETPHDRHRDGRNESHIERPCRYN